MRDFVLKDQELMRKLTHVKQNSGGFTNHRTDESLEDQDDSNENFTKTGNSRFVRKRQSAEERELEENMELLKEIASREDANNLYHIISKNRLEMPITSFKVSLSKDAQSKIFSTLENKQRH